MMLPARAINEYRKSLGLDKVNTVSPEQEVETLKAWVVIARTLTASNIIATAALNMFLLVMKKVLLEQGRDDLAEVLG